MIRCTTVPLPKSSGISKAPITAGMVGVFCLILLRKRVRSIVRFSESIDQQETPLGDQDEAQEGSAIWKEYR